MKINKKKILFYVLYFLITIIFASSMTLAFLIRNPSKTLTTIFQVLFFVSLGYLLFCVVLNIVLLANLKKKSKKVQETVNYLENKRQDIQENRSYRKRLFAQLRLGKVYLVFLYIFLFLLGFSCFIFNAIDLEIPVVMVSSFILADFTATLLLRKKGKMVYQCQMTEKEYPFLYQMISRFAKTFHLNKKHIILIPATDDNITVGKNKKDYVITLSVYLLSLLNEKDLEAILFHEFAHILNQDVVGGEELQKATSFYYSYVEASETGYLSSFLYAPIVSTLLVEVEIYRHHSQLPKEEKADELVKKYHQEENFVHGLVITHSFSTYVELPMPNLMYKDHETFPKDFVSVMVNEFKTHYLSHEDMYRHFIYNELQIRFPTHPIVKERMKALGVTSYDLALAPKDPRYEKEVEKISQTVNEEIYKDSEKDYKDERKENYEDFLADSIYLEGKENKDDLDYATLGSDYLTIAEIDKAKACFLKALEINPDHPLANFQYGLCLILENDAECIPHIRKAMEKNDNAVEPGIDLLGAFYVRNGFEKDRDALREEMVTLLQDKKDKDEDRDSILGIKMVELSLSEEQKEYILSKIEKRPSLVKIYATTRLTKKKFTYHCFYLIFEKNAPKTEEERMYREVFNLLDNINIPDEDFILGYCEEGTEQEKTLMRTKNITCIYKKEDKVN